MGSLRRLRVSKAKSGQEAPSQPSQPPPLPPPAQPPDTQETGRGSSKVSVWCFVRSVSLLSQATKQCEQNTFEHLLFWRFPTHMTTQEMTHTHRHGLPRCHLTQAPLSAPLPFRRLRRSSSKPKRPRSWTPRGPAQLHSAFGAWRWLGQRRIRRWDDPEGRHHT